MFTTIILGAGKSTRMKANKSKLLFDIAGKPIIEHIVDSVQKCKSKNIICVVNKESHELVQLLKSKKVDVSYQKNINGTAGAAESALSLLKTKNSPVLIHYVAMRHSYHRSQLEQLSKNSMVMMPVLVL